MRSSRVRAIARGRVQGVAYRAFAADAAREAGVAGWVRNCADGSVEALLEGEAGAVGRVVEALRRGPGHARVESLETREEPPVGEDGFAIRY